jgi:hypothetical protein
VLETVPTGRIFDPKFNERESTKSSADDLILGRGDVSFRAAFTLRVTESQPHLTWRFEYDLCTHFPHSRIFYQIWFGLLAPYCGIHTWRGCCDREHFLSKKKIRKRE